MLSKIIQLSKRMQLSIYRNINLEILRYGNLESSENQGLITGYLGGLHCHRMSGGLFIHHMLSPPFFYLYISYFWYYFYKIPMSGKVHSQSGLYLTMIFLLPLLFLSQKPNRIAPLSFPLYWAFPQFAVRIQEALGFDLPSVALCCVTFLTPLC